MIPVRSPNALAAAPALSGTAAGLVVPAPIIAAPGPALESSPLRVGSQRPLFSFRWLRRAILRRAGIIALHDEAEAIAREAQALRERGPGGRRRIDAIAVVTSVKAVVLEGHEVVFVVIAVGAAGGLLRPASLGALAAAALVVVLGLLLHGPLTAVPENLLKLVVGVMPGAFFLFWIGEGWRFAWPGQDLAIPVLAGVLLVTALLAGALSRARARFGGRAGVRAWPAIWGLFVDDAGLALRLILWSTLAGPLLPALLPGLEAPVLAGGGVLVLLADLVASTHANRRPPRA